MRVGGGATSSSAAAREQPGGLATVGVLGASFPLLLLLPEAVLDAAIIAAGDDAIAAAGLLQLLLAALTDVVHAPLPPSCSLQFQQSCPLVTRIHVKARRTSTTKPTCM
jgi:hypothetical protein